VRTRGTFLTKSKLTTYSGEEVLCRVRTASSPDELRDCLREARRRGWRVSVRAGQMAFDTQALSEGMVIQLEGFDAIGPVDNGRITVGANAPWGRILEAARQAGYVPYVMVSTEFATAGGTLSSDCLSRFSPTCGKEGNHVERFSLMTLDGKVVECSRTENHDLFAGVISGFGCLGVVLEVTYRLLHVGFSNIVVETTFTPFEGLRGLAHALVTTVEDVRTKHVAAAPTQLDALAQLTAADAHAVSSVVTLNDKRKGFVMRSRYVNGDDHPLHPSPFHEPKSVFQRTLQFFAIFRAPRHFGFWLTLNVFLAKRTTSVDELQGFTFFEGGNDAVRRFLRGLSFRMGIRQQTFVVPLVPGDAAATRDKLADFLEETERLLLEHDVDPTLIDVLYIPNDANEGFVLSSNHALSGYAVTLTFEDLWSPDFPEEDRMLARLSEVCERTGGRVHLVKNVRASTATLARMYAWGVERLKALKEKVDPGHLLTSAFLRRVLPDLVSAGNYFLTTSRLISESPSPPPETTVFLSSFAPDKDTISSIV
jgi:decaprenylphospho-beta-D-ribofuranose 2-oxidase